MSTNLIIFDFDNFDPDDIPGSSDYYYAFDFMTGAFQPKREQLEAIARPGHDNYSYRETGVRGTPFPVTTVLYMPTRSDAVNALDEYVTLIGGAPCVIWSKNQSWGYFDILDVSQVGEPQACLSVIGSLIPASTVRQTVAFLVVSTAAPA